jgi:hypothetical protein
MGRVPVGELASDGRGVDSVSHLLLHPLPRNPSAIATSKPRVSISGFPCPFSVTSQASMYRHRGKTTHPVNF